MQSLTNEDVNIFTGTYDLTNTLKKLLDSYKFLDLNALLWIQI